MIWSARQLSEALGVKVDSSIITGRIQFNSRDVQQGDLFIALQGNRDGHIYAVEAIKQGAAAVIVSHEIAGILPERTIIVDDTMVALNKLAEYKRKNSKAQFIGITGSVGKTSTKELMKEMLKPFGRVFAGYGNFNNYLGVPINLASMPDDTEYAVFEMGMNRGGEIRMLSKMVKPDIAIITSISEAHLEFFNSVIDIADAKCEIFEGLPKQGIAIINLDNKYYGRMMMSLERLNIKSVYTFGKSQNSTSRLTSYEKVGEDVRLVYVVGSTKMEITLPFVPEHYAKNFSAVLMVISCLKLDVKIAVKQLKQIEMTQGRGKIVNVVKKDKKYKLICDYYNANPESLKASFQYLQQFKDDKKIAIIGDMLELGESAIQLHETIAPFIVDSGVKRVILVGKMIECVKYLLPETIEYICFDDVDSVIKELDSLLSGDELILIKGSRGMRLEKIMDYFANNYIGL